MSRAIRRFGGALNNITTNAPDIFLDPTLIFGIVVYGPANMPDIAAQAPIAHPLNIPNVGSNCSFPSKTYYIVTHMLRSAA